MLLRNARRVSTPLDKDSIEQWQLAVSTASGIVLVPETGLAATRRGLGVVRPEGQTIRSWAWANVEDVRLGSRVSADEHECTQFVEVRASRKVHLFFASATAAKQLVSQLERHAPELRVQVPPTFGVASSITTPRAATDADAPQQTERDYARVSVKALQANASKQRHTLRNWRHVSMRERLAPLGTGACALVLLGAGAFAGAGSFGSPSIQNTASSSSGSIMKSMELQYGARKASALPAATTAPAPAPPDLATAALKSHEIFGFAPYWTLPASGGFDVKSLTTLAYFSLDVNADGTVAHDGAGWNGYASQDLVDLITRAHQADDRVVLTVTCFDQSTLDTLTSSPTGAATLATSLIQLVSAKSLDGVNLDFEGKGSADQAGLDRLVAQVSAALHNTNPHWQLTMDTYGTSAGDPQGFYDIKGLAPSVSAFFVMAYDMNDFSTPTPTAPLTGPGFSDLSVVQQYAAAVPASQVILGVPYYGYDWPTSGPAQGDPATGRPTADSYAQIAAGGHPSYWDASSQTAWTSYQVGSQWHQAWFDDATSLALKAQLANTYHLAGLGVWALGMDGNDASMLSALLGNAPAVKDFQPAPVPASAGQSAPSNSTSNNSITAAPPSPAGDGSSSPGTTDPGNGSSGSTSTTTTPTSPPVSYQYGGTWSGSQVTLDKMDPSAVPLTGAQSGQLVGFTTNDPSFSCLVGGPALAVAPVSGASDVYEVTATAPGNCVSGTWEFVGPAGIGTITPQAIWSKHKTSNASVRLASGSKTRFARIHGRSPTST